MDFGSELERKLVGASVHVTRRENDWVFEFSKNLNVIVEAAWRLRNPQSIQLTDSDDGHQYGLPAPIDAEAKSNELLSGCTVTGAYMDDASGDLKIAFSSGTILEVLTNSSGYESWRVYVDGDFFAAVGNGGLR